MWTNEELAWKLDYEGLDYILNQINPSKVEDRKVANLIGTIQCYFGELEAILTKELED